MSEISDLTAEAKKTLKAVKDQVLKPAGAKDGKGNFVNPDAPAVSVGGVGKDSKPFSFTKALVGHIYGANKDKAKFEGNVLDRFRKALVETDSLPPGARSDGYFLPLSFDALGEKVNQHPDCQYVKSVILGSAQPTDLDELKWLMRKGVILKTQSAYAESLGGSLVGPPTFGDVIPLVRPEAAVLAAGASQMALPPTGRHVRPRITAAPSVRAVAESQATPESDLGTDQMELSAKKIAGAVRISEEATNFTSGTLDNFAKAELDRSLGLKMDAYAFYGTGTTSVPAGLLAAQYSGAIINVETAYPAGRGVGTNGNRLLPEYGDYFPALIGERSFNMDANTGCWVMRPSAYASAQGLRGDGPVPGDRSGPLVDILRRFAEGGPSQWRGRKVVQSTNIDGTRSKGTGTALSDVFYGIWKHCIVATYGAVQMTQGHDGNSFLNGQYIMRAVMFGDIGFEYPQAFLYYPNVLGVQDEI